MKRIKKLFSDKEKKVLSIYFTAGFPNLNDTGDVLSSLQEHGAQMIEIGMPYSDPLADGPVIQQSSMKALENGITISKLFEQLQAFKDAGFRDDKVVFILMGYLNPVLQFGLEEFLTKAQSLGVDGLIIPDLPINDYERQYKKLFNKYKLPLIFLVTPETSVDRIRKIDKLSGGFIYAVSSSSTTGINKDIDAQSTYFERLSSLNLKNPTVVGFGIRDAKTFQEATRFTQGAIIGTAYIKALSEGGDVNGTTGRFLNSILAPHAG